MTKTKALFTDAIYGKKTVKAINKALAAGDAAVTTWDNCREIVQEHEGCDFDTAPCEFILGLIIEELKLENWEALAGLVGWGHHKETRPQFWTGVDAADFDDGKYEVDWYDVELIAEAVGYDPCVIYAFYMECAMDAKRDGDLEACAALACQGLAAMNYYEQEVA